MSLRQVARILNPRALRVALAPSSRGFHRRHLGPRSISEEPWRRDVAEMMEKFENVVGKNFGPFQRWPFAMREVTLSDNKLEINLDLKEFSPEEIKVTQEGGVLRVEASHEKRVEGNEAFGHVARELKREYVLPEGVDLESLTTNLSEHGILSIIAKVQGQKSFTGKEIPISRPGSGNSEKQ